MEELLTDSKNLTTYHVELKYHGRYTFGTKSVFVPRCFIPAVKDELKDYVIEDRHLESTNYDDIWFNVSGPNAEELKLSLDNLDKLCRNKNNPKSHLGYAYLYIEKIKVGTPSIDEVGGLRPII